MHISEIFDDYSKIQQELSDNSKIYIKIYLYLWSIKILQLFYSNKLKNKIFYNDISPIINTDYDDFYYDFFSKSFSELNDIKRELLTTVIPSIYPRKIKINTILPMNSHCPILLYNSNLNYIYIIFNISDNQYGILDCITGNILEIICSDNNDFHSKINNIINFSIIENIYFCTYVFTTNSNSLIQTNYNISNNIYYYVLNDTY